MKQCPRCGCDFTPMWLGGLRTWSRFCGTCSWLNLARGLEHSEPGDSIADISSGEQVGAAIRAFIYGGRKISEPKQNENGDS